MIVLSAEIGGTRLFKTFYNLVSSVQDFYKMSSIHLQFVFQFSYGIAVASVSITICLLLLTYLFLIWFYIYFLRSKYLQLFCVILYSCFLFNSFTARFRSIILNCNTQIYLKGLSIFWAFSILDKSLYPLCLDVIIFILSGLHKPRAFTLQFNRLYTNELI